MKGLADCKPRICFLRPFHDRAEAGEEDIVLRLVPDRNDLFDSGLPCGVEERVSVSMSESGVQQQLRRVRLVLRGIHNSGAGLFILVKRTMQRENCD